MLASNETTLSFEKAIQEINAIVKLAGLSGGYSFGDKTGEEHNMEIFLAAPKKLTPNFAANGDDDDDEAMRDSLSALLADDFNHLNSFIGIFGMYMIKASGAVRNPSTTFDLLYDRMHHKLMQLSEGAAVRFSQHGPMGEKLGKDKDIQTASMLIKDIANLFTKYHS